MNFVDKNIHRDLVNLGISDYKITHYHFHPAGLSKYEKTSKDVAVNTFSGQDYYSAAQYLEHFKSWNILSFDLRVVGQKGVWKVTPTYVTSTAEEICHGATYTGNVLMLSGNYAKYRESCGDLTSLSEQTPINGALVLNRSCAPSEIIALFSNEYIKLSYYPLK